MSSEKMKPGYLFSTLDNRCRLKTTLKMHPACPVCGQPREFEVGFYFGAAYVSYGLTVAFSIFTFVAWWLLIGISVQEGDLRLLWWGITNAVLLVVLQPIFMRLSRSLWLSWFVTYDPDWRTNNIAAESTERIVPEQMNNW